mmetsp:Transcript_28148/g.74300  ORF Transcript_28148/g.74300 Transcript_28148/m.74300 type:complete len:169 (+) Transcript_28148:288-794(+)
MCEPGAMLHTVPGIESDISSGGTMLGLRRCCCAGESFFRIHYLNRTMQAQTMTVTPPFPAKVIPVDLNRYSGLVMKRRAYLASIGRNVEFGLKRPSTVGTALCGGQGLLLPTIYGTGVAFLNAGGTVMERELAPGEVLLVDKHALVACESTVDIGVAAAVRGALAVTV